MVVDAKRVESLRVPPTSPVLDPARILDGAGFARGPMALRRGFIEPG